MSDPFLWLEEIEGERASAKICDWNQRTAAELEADPLYNEIASLTHEVLFAKDRIPFGVIRGQHVFNYWQDETHSRGIWRRTSVDEYQMPEPQWQTLIDLDELAKQEGENWVWSGWTPLFPSFNRALVHLSRGGKDAHVTREFDLTELRFVEGGFWIPESKGTADWIDIDTLLTATDFGPATLSKSGYPRQVRVWRRGRPLSEAKLVYEASLDDISASPWVVTDRQRIWPFVYRAKTHFTNEIFLISTDGSATKLPLPDHFMPRVVFRGCLIGILMKDWSVKSLVFKGGSVIAIRLDDLSEKPELVYEPTMGVSVESVAASESALLLEISVKVKSRLLRAWRREDGGWRTQQLELPDDGVINVRSACSSSSTVIVEASGFLRPEACYLVHTELGGEEAGVIAHRIRELPSRFRASDLLVEQLEAKSVDGQMIPYFIVRPRALKLDSSNPTVLTGYGGFNISKTPFYLNAIGKSWCERGGVFVLANIRGGGEFGPAWHEAARLQNRQRAFDDFIGVAEDLIARKITSPDHLGISGGSNGGLLVGATFTQRPDLFKGVVCMVPLLDMMRYHKLLAGYSWMDEYGDPDDPLMSAVIRAYSPYQNLRPDKKYPHVFFITSQSDDRVHPGHARKMAALMEAQGHPFLYFENMEGGHGISANLSQAVRFEALRWTYFWRVLSDRASSAVKTLSGAL